MKKIQIFLFCLIAFSCYSQEPVKWDFAVSDIKNGELKLTIKAEIDENWRLYSPKVYEDGPLATEINFFSDKRFIALSTAPVLTRERSDMYSSIVMPRSFKSDFIKSVSYTHLTLPTKA